MWDPIAELIQDARRMRVPIAGALAFGTAVLAAALLLSAREGISPADLTRDPLQTRHAHFYIGFVSNLGVLVWTSSAAFSLCAGLALRGAAGRGRTARFHLVAGCLTLVLTLDDFFLFHEKIWPFFTGLPDAIVMGAYAAFAAAFALRFRDRLRAGSPALLGLAVAFLGLSVAMDLLLPQHDTAVFVEDGLKWFGILFWALFFTLQAVRDLRAATAPATAAPRSA